jgi:hypothetical protein
MGHGGLVAGYNKGFTCFVPCRVYDAHKVLR